MVQLELVPDDRRDRARRKRRAQFLAAAAELVSEGGPSALTMASLADRCDCAVGTAYSYFRSKAALLGAVQRNAVDTLRRSELSARAEWEAYLEEREVGERDAALVRLVAFGAFVVAASMTFPNETAMLQILLGDRRELLPDDEIEGSLAALRTYLGEPVSLLRLAEGAEALQPGDATERAVVWVGSLNGVLLVDVLGRVAPQAFRPPHLARRLTSDLLLAWGADPGALARAGSHVERIAATTALAPPVPPVEP